MQNRREFFSSFGGLVRGQKKEDVFYPLPPFFDSNKSHLCAECDNPTCVNSCEEEIIKRGADGSPFLDFSLRGCTFCDECASSCEKEVFSKEYPSTIVATITIDESACMAWHNTICKSCFDPCLDRAIDFTGLFFPSINPQKCTACGFCIGVCPTKAIKVKRIEK